MLWENLQVSGIFESFADREMENRAFAIRAHSGPPKGHTDINGCVIIAKPARARDC